MNHFEPVEVMKPLRVGKARHQVSSLAERVQILPPSTLLHNLHLGADPVLAGSELSGLEVSEL